MARRIAERLFNPSEALMATRRFTAGGRRYVPGDHFPWRRLSLSLKQTKVLFDQFKLGHLDTKTPEKVKTRPEGAKTPEGAETSPEEVPQSPETGAGTPEDSDIFPVDADEVVSIGDLARIDVLKELQEIASGEGAPVVHTKAGQRGAIIKHRES